MTIVWFNGPSRNELINALPRQNLEIGCNYITADRAVDYVCVYDRVIKEKLKILPNTEYRTIARNAHLPHWKPVVNSEDATNSGMLAVLLATQISQEPIYILGCDWGLNEQTVYDYGKGRQRKYNNHCRKYLQHLSKSHDISIVHNHRPDVSINVIKIDQFFALHINNTIKKDLI